MSKKKEIIPELRFPEFRNEGEWEIIKLKQFGTFYRGLTYGAADTASNGLLVLRSGNIQNDTLILNNDLVFVDKECPENLKLLNGDIVICMSNGSKTLVGKNAEYKGNYEGEITVGAFCSILRPKNNFTKYLLQSDIYQDFIALSIGGGNINNLKNSDLEEFSCSAPKNRKEQQKIASCLSSLDNLIDAYNQNMDLLQAHKQGLMQILFPQVGEKVPKYRFKEFEKDGVWTEKSLDEVATILKGKGISKADIVEDGDLPCIRYGELYTHYKETIRTVKSYTNSNADDLVLSKANDVIIPASGETQIDIATASCVLESGIALGSDLNIIRSKINGVFLSYYLNNSKKHDIAQMAQGIAVVHLYPNQLKTLQLQIPSTKEQIKIASCLSSLDEIISTQVEKIEHLKQHKKGLMQVLFPKIID